MAQSSDKKAKPPRSNVRVEFSKPEHNEVKKAVDNRNKRAMEGMPSLAVAKFVRDAAVEKAARENSAKGGNK